MGFLGGSDSKESACIVGDLGWIPGLGRSPEKGKGYPLIFWPGEFHALYSPWGCKESDTTEQLSLSQGKPYNKSNIGVKKMEGIKDSAEALT